MLAYVPSASLPAHCFADAKYGNPSHHLVETVDSQNFHYRHVHTYNPFNTPIVSSIWSEHFEDEAEPEDYQSHAPFPKHY